MQSYSPVSIESKSGLVQIANNIWIIESTEYVCYPPATQTRNTQNTTLIRLKDGSLFVIFPIEINLELNKALKADIEKLGPVKYLISPDPIHYWNRINWSQEYPDAKIYTLFELASQQITPDVQKTHAVDQPMFEWIEEIEPYIFSTDSELFKKALFFHSASRTVIFVKTCKHISYSSQSAPNTSKLYSHQVLETIQQWKPNCIVITNSACLYIEGRKEISNFLDSALDDLNLTPAIVDYTIDAAKLTATLLFIIPIYLFVILATDIAYPQLASLMSTFIERSTNTKGCSLIGKLY
ncbi:MAG: hypothetical protein AAFQ63_15270 [Cyanobacteria bacterium J06621_11]